jgi:hypothetical protein
MNSLKIAAAVILFSGCSTPQERDREALMNQIEKQVRLPINARSLDEYARYYADGEDGKVVAVYLIPINDELPPDQSCEELLENLMTRELPCELVKSDWAMPAGKRRWMKSEQNLPFISDGGCAQVTVIFEKAKSVVKSAECNGVA